MRYRSGKYSEKDFTTDIRSFAKTVGGWLEYHTYDSRRSTPGFPDLVLVRDERLIFAELKVGRGKLSQFQKMWLSELHKVPKVEVYLWHPTDWENICDILR